MKVFLLSFTAGLILFILIPSLSLKALDIGPDCPAPRYVPSACTDVYQPGKSAGYTVDLNCSASKFIDPSNKCCLNKCVDKDGNTEQSGNNNNGEDPDNGLSEQYRKFEVFGTSIRINPENIGTLINLAFTTFLGIVSLYTVLRGIYVAGVKRPNVTAEEDVKKVYSELVNLVVGFSLAWGFIIILQLVSNFLGIGKLSDLDFTSSGEGSLVITVK